MDAPEKICHSVEKVEPLKKIKQNPAWSEEDENILNAVTYTVKNSGYKRCLGVSNEIMVNWLKSIRDRYAWKPSDAQIEALTWVLSLANNCGEECAFDLRTLQEELTKLREK